MSRLPRSLTLVMMVLTCALISGPAFAQGASNSSISGVVVDSGGGMIPGATITATNAATAGTSTAVSAANGTFTIPGLIPGKYTVNVALQGFKTAVLKDVLVSAGAPGTVRAVLEVGGITETIVVEGASEVVQTQSSAAAATVGTNQISNLPVGSRNTLDFVTFLPGVQTPGGSRDSIVNGLPQSSLNITVDGVSVQDNYLKTTDGFFARMSPRLDAVEEVTVTSAGNGADSNAMGSTQIQFTTRSGSNLFSGSAYYYYQSEKLNTNTYFNKLAGLPKNVALQKQPGIRVGGPVYIPKVYDGRGKAFFFFNYEENRTPRTRTDTSDFMTPEAQSGIYRYLTSNGVVQTVNLYDLARANGQTATPDATIAKLLSDIAASAGQGVVEPLQDNYNAQRLRFQQPAPGLTRYPTARLDYNLSPAHRLNGSWSFNDLVSRPDTTNTRQSFFPGFPVNSSQISDRYVFQTSLRSTLSSNLVNEVKYGMSGGATLFSPDLTADMFKGPLANQNGYVLGISAAGVRNAGSGGGISSREASTKFIDQKLNWLRGAHSMSLGTTYTQADVWLLTQTRATTINFGLPNGDPALPMFNTTNFPNSSTAQRNAANGLYATLTGHVTSISGTARLDANTGQYVYNGDSRQEGRLRELDFFIQDNWKVKPNLSLNVGLRYAIQLPFYAKNGSYSTATIDDAWGMSGNAAGCDPSAVTPETCNLFKQGVQPGGIVPTYQNLGKGVKAYNTDFNNWAPSVGVNWTPSAEGGFLRKILGEQGDTSLSAGWSRGFERHGMSDFTGVLGNNPGLTVNADRSAGNGNIGTLPLLLRDGNLGPPSSCSSGPVTSACIPVAPTYPIAATGTGSINIFDPNLQVPYSDSWTVGYQRAVGRRSAVEVRYIGTRNRENWRAYNYNELNIKENGFLDEFKRAQNNLYSNIAAGRGESFAYFGPGTGTSPLPIYLAYLRGTPLSQGGNCADAAACASLYPSGTFTNTNFVNPLSRFNPNPFTPAGTNSSSGLQGTATQRANAVAAGLPRNFFLANPDMIGGANVTGHGDFTTFKGMQVQFRRRMSGGLLFDTSYALSNTYNSTRYSFRVGRLLTRDTGGEGDVTHAVKGTFVYELPFGQGKRYAGDVGGLMNGIVGGWQVSGAWRIQTDALIDLGNVRIVGMSAEEAGNAFGMRKVSDSEIYWWPQDIIDNTIKAYSRDLNGFTRGAPTGRYFAPANYDNCIETIAAGYGDCGVRTFVLTPQWFKAFDLSFVKEVKLQGRKNLQLRIDMLNALDLVNFDPESGVGNTTLADWQVTGANSARTIQLVARFNW